MIVPHVLQELLFLCWYRISTQYWPLPKFGYQNQYREGKNGLEDLPDTMMENFGGKVAVPAVATAANTAKQPKQR